MSKNLDIIARHYQANKNGDFEGMFADFDANITWVATAGIPYGGTYIGKQEIINNVFAAIKQDWPQFKFEMEKLIDGGQQIIATGSYTGTSKKGLTFTARAVHMWDLKDGKIVRYEQFIDSALLVKALNG